MNTAGDERFHVTEVRACKHYDSRRKQKEPLLHLHTYNSERRRVGITLCRTEILLGESRKHMTVNSRSEARADGIRCGLRISVLYRDRIVGSRRVQSYVRTHALSMHEAHRPTCSRALAGVSIRPAQQPHAIIANASTRSSIAWHTGNELCNGTSICRDYDST